MNIGKYKDFTVEDFVSDKYFLNWVLNSDNYNDQFWRGFILEFPEKREHINDAVLIIKSIRAIEPKISQQRIDDLYGKIYSIGPAKGTDFYKLSKIAVIFFLFIIILGSLYYFSSIRLSQSFDIADNNFTNKGQIILPDGTISEFESEKAQIQQLAGGGLIVNNDTVIQTKSIIKYPKNALIHIIIPYGKRSEIILTDSTRIWLNSGSRFSYPADFEKSTREVYLSGEAFFDVVEDSRRLFRVVTNDLRITVTGTRFNVSSYIDDPVSQIVLISGRVTAGKNKLLAGNIEIEPGERFLYNRQEDNILKDNVDVKLFSSWVDGFLIFKEEQLEKIFTLLCRYYNKKILSDNLSSQITFSGKLDLADDLEKVLNNIAYSASLTVECKGDIFILNP